MAQEITTKTIQPLSLESGLVRPFDKKIVYSTGSTPHTPEGMEMEVHPLLAESLIKAGKATEKPKGKKGDKE